MRSKAHHRARERRDSASKGAGKREERPGPRGGRLRAKNGVNHDNRVGFDGNPLGSDAKPEAMPEGGVEPE